MVATDCLYEQDARNPLTLRIWSVSLVGSLVSHMKETSLAGDSRLAMGFVGSDGYQQ